MPPRIEPTSLEAQAGGRSTDRKRRERGQPPPTTQRAIFATGDLMFLLCAGIAATLTMHVVHMLGWPFVPTSLVGMVAAMAAQTALAVAVAPLLGSIESMVPSMIVGMVSPMIICVLHLMGCESTWAMAAAIGSTFAVGMFAFIQFHARRCQRALTHDNRRP